MAEIITMPRLSDTMEEGKLIRWYKKVGDKISEGDILAEIKTDKVNQDFEVDVSGILLYAGLEEGESTKVDQILAIIGEEGEDISELIPNKRYVEKHYREPQRIEKHSSTRKIISKRLSESKFTAPHYYLTVEIDMEKILKLRQEVNKKLTDVKITINDFIIKASALAILEHKLINAFWTEENIVYNAYINIGVAVSIKSGLLVPVIFHADQKSIKQISFEVKDKSNRARIKRIKAKEIEGSSFTISNLGMFGIESFTSIINQPNSCIQSVGSIVEKPFIKRGRLSIGYTMKTTLACDHRIIDGSVAAEYLRTFKKFIEDPFISLI
ncbi:MAG TPA: dihydrolipoamide acetyltransferase family protein [Candidatus Angelobacter sp.]|jgi:pyruvate dehydrogenase E2 component (dihydrolipoamide acetyltransferase)|nr:dihydrolipoamide acetyltransferase family protein [Candidatus Angelobacter sp.]